LYGAFDEACVHDVLLGVVLMGGSYYTWIGDSTRG
jgi:hypothetical protein